MSDAITRINEAMDDAIAAQEAGQYAAALTRARTAWMLSSGMPNSEFDDERLDWKPEAIERVVTNLQRLASAQAGNATDPTTGGRVGALSQVSLVHYRRG